MAREALSEKILVLGVDGMDPETSKYHLEEGIMPNFQKFLERGAAREDLYMLGSHPTITPPMWTTLACGCHPYEHGVTDFWRQKPGTIDVYGYGLDSTNCFAEQTWNVFAEAGKNTVVWHWPGASWPPTSDSPNLTVVDGTQPEGVNMGVGQVYGEFLVFGDVNVKETTYRTAVTEGAHKCVITDLEEKEEGFDITSIAHASVFAPEMKIVNLPRPNDDPQMTVGALTTKAMDASIGKIRDAKGWAAAPDNAKETEILFSKGLVRRPVQILADENGVYNKIAIYKNKKATEPIVVLDKDVYVQDIVDESIKNDKHYEVTRSMRIVEMAEDGTSFRMWCSAEMDIHADKVWSPKSLFKEITENVGYPQPVSNIGASDPKLIVDCMIENWQRHAEWQANCLHYMIEEKGAEIIFSHFHNEDALKHMFVQFLKENEAAPLAPAQYHEYMKMTSKVTDYYIGRFLHLLDEGWTIFIVSDHGQTCSLNNERNPMLIAGVNGHEMLQWGFTVLKQDADGNYLPEIDWTKTKAVQIRFNEIYINLKGRNQHELEDGTIIDGIVDPADKWEVEEEIITKLYEFKGKTTGKRMISVALRNKDAVHFGLGGPECGDIVFFTTDGYNEDHGDALSTAIGFDHTSQAPIFAAAGKGIKENFRTNRVIREIDLAPTVAAIGGVRMPRNCEGAPVYQIIDAE